MGRVGGGRVTVGLLGWLRAGGVLCTEAEGEAGRAGLVRSASGAGGARRRKEASPLGV